MSLWYKKTVLAIRSVSLISGVGIFTFFSVISDFVNIGSWTLAFFNISFISVADHLGLPLVFQAKATMKPSIYFDVC